MTKFLDVYVGGVKIDDVEDIIPPSEEKPLWLIIRNGQVVACASKGATVEYRKVGEAEFRQAMELITQSKTKYIRRRLLRPKEGEDDEP